MWKFLGNRPVEAHIGGSAQANETEFVKVCVSFAVLSYLLKFRCSREPQFELQRERTRERERIQVFQLKEGSRWSIEEKPVEVRTAGIGHGSREVGRKTSSRRVKIKCNMRVN
jgi:hypothetical protein